MDPVEFQASLALLKKAEPLNMYLEGEEGPQGLGSFALVFDRAFAELTREIVEPDQVIRTTAGQARLRMYDLLRKHCGKELLQDHVADGRPDTTKWLHTRALQGPDGKGLTTTEAKVAFLCLDENTNVPRDIIADLRRDLSEEGRIEEFGPVFVQKFKELAADKLHCTRRVSKQYFRFRLCEILRQHWWPDETPMSQTVGVHRLRLMRRKLTGDLRIDRMMGEVAARDDMSADDIIDLLWSPPGTQPKPPGMKMELEVERRPVRLEQPSPESRRIKKYQYRAGVGGQRRGEGEQEQEENRDGEEEQDQEIKPEVEEEQDQKMDTGDKEEQTSAVALPVRARGDASFGGGFQARN